VVTYSDLPGNKLDWISIAQTGTGDSAYLHYKYTDGSRSGEMRFPSLSPGAYEVRVYFNWPEGRYDIQSRHEFIVK